jgi:uncharacterized protein YndB with AHSA1/START domain
MAEQVGGDEGFTMTREFDAPREDVWREWTDPAAFADWFGAPSAEVRPDSVSMDVRAGGAWRATMLAGRNEIQWSGEYLEVVEPERLVLSIADQPEPERWELVTVVLTDLGEGRTRMVVEQSGHMTPEQYERAKQGWTGFFVRMAERLAG